MTRRSRLSLAVAVLFAVAVAFSVLGCGKNYYYAGRNLPPSGLTQRVLVAIDNPSGSLQFMDAYYDIRHPYNNATGEFSISSYNASNPVTIQNLPEEQAGLVYASGDGSLTPINYGTEAAGKTVVSGGTIASSIFGSHKQDYFVAADQAAHALAVTDVGLGQTLLMDIPNVYRVSMNANATLVLAFSQNSNDVYSIFKLTPSQQSQYATKAAWQAAGYRDCEPQTLPKYCAVQVTDTSKVFDRPVKGIFSADGQNIYVLNCGRECGGTNSGIVTIPISNSVLNANSSGPAGLSLAAGTVTSVPAGATNAIQSGNTLYVAGQQLQSDGLLAGYLSVLSVATSGLTVTNQYAISDGTHNKMSFADDNTLWIGSQRCQNGERYAQNQAGSDMQYGCLTRVDLTKIGSGNPVTVDRYIGDLTGIADVEGLHKIYVGEAGQVHIYRTTDFAELDNSNVTVTGTVSDVAYMDAASDGNNTTY